MRKISAFILLALGLMASGAATTACMWWFVDEPSMPKSLIK
jgi:cyclic lactone autoinducer peptide